MNLLARRCIEDHQEFLLDHARASEEPSKTLALTTLLALATILQCEGMERSALLKAIDSARLTERKASEVLH